MLDVVLVPHLKCATYKETKVTWLAWFGRGVLVKAHVIKTRTVVAIPIAKTGLAGLPLAVIECQGSPGPWRLCRAFEISPRVPVFNVQFVFYRFVIVEQLGLLFLELRVLLPLWNSGVQLGLDVRLDPHRLDLGDIIKVRTVGDPIQQVPNFFCLAKTPNRVDAKGRHFRFFVFREKIKTGLDFKMLSAGKGCIG